jgi:hypothetical protein
MVSILCSIAWKDILSDIPKSPCFVYTSTMRSSTGHLAISHAKPTACCHTAVCAQGLSHLRVDAGDSWVLFKIDWPSLIMSLGLE